MRKTLLRIGFAGLALALLGSLVIGPAQALELRAGKLLVVTDGGFSPTTLPKHRNAPIRLRGFAKISNVDGTRPSPLTRLVLEFDRHGAVETRGLPKCTQAKLVATTAKHARRNCGGAIVGTGFGSALVELPEQRGIRASTPITLFNGPVKNGNPTVIGHGHLDYPAPTTYLVPIEIEKINKGRYGFRTVVDFPKIANYYGSPIYGRVRVGREWNHRGKRLSFSNARCPDGRLQARGQFEFRDKSSVQGTLFRPCKVRR